MAIEIVDFPIKNGGSFHGKMLVHQRVQQKKFSVMLKPQAEWSGGLPLKPQSTEQPRPFLEQVIVEMEQFASA